MAIVVADAETLQIVEVNSATCDMYGYSRKEMLDLLLIQLSGEPEKSRERLNQVFKTNTFLRSEAVHKRKDGHLFSVELAMTLSNVSNKETLVAVMRDITESNYIKEQLRKQQDNLEQQVKLKTHDLLRAKEKAEEAARSKTEFLANMSHELRTPMHSILSFSKLGKRSVEKQDFEKSARFFSRVETSGEQLLGLINDLLDLSKLEAGKMTYEIKEHCLKGVIEHVMHELETLADNKNISLSMTSVSRETKFQFDKVRIAQVVRNLFSNAIKFTPEHKTISVTINELQATPDTQKIMEIRIADQGHGIPDGELEMVFDKFAQSSKTNSGSGGTGLGLPICKEIVDAHEGTIHAEHNPEGGAIFVVTLPCK